MKRLLNTLFVSREDAKIVKDGDCLLVKAGNEVLLRTPILLLGGVVCLGRIFVSPQALAHCAQNDVAVSFLSQHGRYLARVQGPISGNVLLRRQQYRDADDPDASAAIARPVVTAKTANCRTVLRRAARGSGNMDLSSEVAAAADDLTSILIRLERTPTLDAIRGLEGEAAARYFDTFDHLITQQKDAFFFRRRNRRPPLDRVNCLLSFLYTLLVHDVSAACQATGLDPQVGFLHRDRPGRPSLALDLMEDLRPILVDRLVLSLVNRRQVAAKDFRASATGAVTMSDDCRKAVIVAFQERKKQEVTHSFLGEKTPMGMLPHIQALLLSRHLRGDLDAYVPYIHRS